MNDRVTISIVDGVADVRLARPEKMNALDPAMFQALSAAGERLKTEAALRAVVLSGEGRAFCAGLDMASFAAIGATEASPMRDLKARTHGLANLFQHVAWVWRDVPVPVIAAVHGVAFGGGFQIMLGADMRYVAPDTQLSIMEIKWGLVPDMAGTQLMRNLAREDIVRELTYTGRVFSGIEAQQYGFATRVSDDPRSCRVRNRQGDRGEKPARDSRREALAQWRVVLHDGRGAAGGIDRAAGPDPQPQSARSRVREHAEARAALFRSVICFQAAPRTGSSAPSIPARHSRLR